MGWQSKLLLRLAEREQLRLRERVIIVVSKDREEIEGGRESNSLIFTRFILFVYYVFVCDYLTVCILIGISRFWR